MANTAINSVEQYIASRPEAVRVVLTQVREAIRRALPKAEESISYNMPTYKIAGAPVIYFAAWKSHYSLYPATARLLEAVPDLASYKVEKGTFRFRYTEAVPSVLIAGMARFRAEEAALRST